KAAATQRLRFEEPGVVEPYCEDLEGRPVESFVVAVEPPTLAGDDGKALKQIDLERGIAQSLSFELRGDNTSLPPIEVETDPGIEIVALRDEGAGRWSLELLAGADAPDESQLRLHWSGQVEGTPVLVLPLRVSGKVGTQPA